MITTFSGPHYTSQASQAPCMTVPAPVARCLLWRVYADDVEQALTCIAECRQDAERMGAMLLKAPVERVIARYLKTVYVSNGLQV